MEGIDNGGVNSHVSLEDNGNFANFWAQFHCEHKTILKTSLQKRKMFTFSISAFSNFIIMNMVSS